MYHSEPYAKIYQGDSRHMELPDKSVHMVCTSPPYWGLRKYDSQSSDAFGSEPTPELYVEHTLEFLAEIWRVLRDDGTVWWNCGDSMWGGGNNRGKKSAISEKQASNTGATGQCARDWGRHPVIKPLDMCLIPQQVAIVARAQGWYVRSWVMWEKSNPMCESLNGWRWEKCRIKIRAGTKGIMGDPLETGITNRHFEKDLAQWQDCPGCPKCLSNDGLVLRRGAWRPTDSIDYILMMTKTNKYYGDRESVREKSVCIDSFGSPQQDTRITHGIGSSNSGINEAKRKAKETGGFAGRNLRNVWKFPTQSAGFEHYAAFPQRLPEICIQASTSEYGVCAECGAPYARILGNPTVASSGGYGSRTADECELSPTSGIRTKSWTEYETLGWRKTCRCQTDEIAPAVVLDPFCGTGTTLYVAKKLGRIGIGYDLSAKYCEMSRKRVSKVEPTRRMV